MVGWAAQLLEVAAADALDAPALAAVAYPTLNALLVLAARAQAPILPDALVRSAMFTSMVDSLDDPALERALLPQPSTPPSCLPRARGFRY
jgi:hypothetical protein